MIFAGYKCVKELLKDELVQKTFEGIDVSDALKQRIDAMEGNDIQMAQKVWSVLNKIPNDSDYERNHPYKLNAIRELRPEGPRRLAVSLTDDEFLDKFHGAWSGRAAGCALGKPVEGIGMFGTAGLSGREAIKKYLMNQKNWPLDNYFSNKSCTDDIQLSGGASFRETIQYMEPDDDIHYTLIAIKVLNQYGCDFKWHNIAQTWNNSLSYSSICTAETQAILNYNLMTPRGGGGAGCITSPYFTATNNNPYREWIGAQIRADGWGYVCAGNPELAAEFAYRDACWTHTANGIYGEMFMAAVISASFVVSNPYDLIKIGLSEIPANCKLSVAIREAMNWLEECRDFESFMDRLDEKYANMSPVHTINNALIVLMSLFYGRMKFDESICISVMGGLDTDCNGATTGSIVGAVNGIDCVESKLVPPLNDTIKPMVFGFQKITMKELANKTLALWKANRSGY